MSDTIVIMNDGVIQQIGTPVEVYDEPDNRFVADFIGESNIFDGTYRSRQSDDDFGEVAFAGHEWKSADHGFDSGPVDVIIRPEDIKLVPLRAEDESDLSGEIKSIIYKGSFYEIMVITADNFSWKCFTNDIHSVGEKVAVHIDPYNVRIMKKL